MSAAALLEAGRAPVTQARPRRVEAVGASLGPLAAAILRLQRGAGNTAVARQLALQRSSADRRERPFELQRMCPECEDEAASNPEGEPPLLERVDEEAPVQRSSSPAPTVVQRAGDPAKIPGGLVCPPDLSAGAPTGTAILFPIAGFAVTPAHSLLLTSVFATWLIGGGTDDLIVHGYASKVGDEGRNWTLSCNRADAVRAELERLGIPPVRIKVLAHGKTNEFGAGRGPNQRAVVTTRRAGLVPLPLVRGVLTARDNFAGRSTTRFGVGETIDLSFFSLPPTPPAAFGGLEWHLVAGGGTLAGGGAGAGTATYTAPAGAAAVTLELRVAGGATAGRVVSTHALTIVTPDSVRITEVPGTAPNFRIGGTIAAGTWGAGFLGNVFVGPRDVSFQGVVFGEGTVPSVIIGRFLRPLAGAHPVNTFGPGHGGNATTGTPVSPPSDQIFGLIGPIAPTFGVRICGTSDFLWAIPWEFSVAGGPRTRFATANHHMTSSPFCDATIEKGGAGPFTRPI